MRWPEADRVLIVACGPSVGELKPEEIGKIGATVIAVNGAIDWLGRPDYWFSLDPSAINLVRANNPKPGVKYVMAVPMRFEIPDHVTRISRIIGKCFGKARSPGGLFEQPTGVHTGNSAFGALGLAYHMRPRKIALLGVDGTQERRIDGGFPRTLAHLPELFSSAVDQLRRVNIEIVNGSPKSAVTCFPRMRPKEALEWLT